VGAWRQRNFRLLLIGQTVSSLGNMLVPVALAFAVLDLADSASDLGYVLGASAVAMLLFMPIAGLLADRLSRRALMMAADSVRGTAQLAMGLLLVSGRPAVLTIAALSAVVGAGSAIFIPAATGLTPALVPPEYLQQANGLQQTGNAAAGIAGPAIAGLLVVTIGPGWAIFADGISFAVSVGLLAWLRVDRVVRPGSRWTADLREGWHDFWSRSWFWTVVLAFALVNFLFAAYMVLGPVASKRYYDGAAAWATFGTAMAAGSVVGGIIAIKLSPRRPLRLGLPVTALAALMPLALAARLPVAAVACAAAVAGAGLIVFATLWQTSVQRNIPEDRLSRASSYDYLGSLIAAPVGFAVAGPAESAIGLTAALLWVGGLIVAVTALLLLLPSVRGLGGGVTEGGVSEGGVGESGVAAVPES
jgi:predicted MFS family arabinose efflux permease